jgi:hypothetical protein
LFTIESLPNIFYTEKGVIAEFFAALVVNDRKHRALLPWIFDRISSGLEQLNRKDDAKAFKALKKKHLTKK